MGFSINFKTKSGRSNSVAVLIAVGNHEVLKKKGNRGDLQKKKKVNAYTAAHFASFSGGKLHNNCISIRSLRSFDKFSIQI